MSTILKVGTRGSKLALAQCEQIVDELRKQNEDVAFELVVIKTQGDINSEKQIKAPTEVGSFVRTIENALTKGEIDIAIHSMKDMPTKLASGTFIAAVPRRADVRDMLISRAGQALDELPEGATVGTSSPRRMAQLLRLRPDLKIKSVRGNIDTRLAKLNDSTELDAIMLASAGVDRLGLDMAKKTERLAPERFLPAAAQGALALQVSYDNTKARDAVAQVDDTKTRMATVAERSFLATLECGCQAPVGALGQYDTDGTLKLECAVFSLCGKERAWVRSSAHPADAISLGQVAALEIIRRGARELLTQNVEKC